MLVTLGVWAGYVVRAFLNFKLDVGLHAVFTEGAATLDDFGGLAGGDFPEAQLAEEDLLRGLAAAGHEPAARRVEGVARRGGHGQQAAAARAHPAGGAAGRQARTGHPESVDGPQRFHVERGARRRRRPQHRRPEARECQHGLALPHIAAAGAPGDLAEVGVVDPDGRRQAVAAALALHERHGHRRGSDVRRRFPAGAGGQDGTAGASAHLGSERGPVPARCCTPAHQGPEARHRRQIDAAPSSARIGRGLPGRGDDQRGGAPHRVAQDRGHADQPVRATKRFLALYQCAVAARPGLADAVAPAAGPLGLRLRA